MQTICERMRAHTCVCKNKKKVGVLQTDVSSVHYVYTSDKIQLHCIRKVQCYAGIGWVVAGGVVGIPDSPPRGSTKLRRRVFFILTPFHLRSFL